MRSRQATDDAAAQPHIVAQANDLQTCQKQVSEPRSQLAHFILNEVLKSLFFKQSTTPPSSILTLSITNRMPNPQSKMYLSILTTLLILSQLTVTAPTNTIEERHILTETHILPRQQQQNIPQLLTLASLAGITLPTDPAVLISLGTVAAQLQSYLPTSSVLSVLETAAPPEFLSNIVHDPSYAMSFEEAFAKGSSPSWFLALPTDVKEYLHTYSNYGGVATAVGELGSVASGATTGSGSGTGSAMTGSGSGSSSVTTGSGTSQTSSTGKTSASGETSSGSAANAQTTSPSTTVAAGGAARPTGPLALGSVIAVGVLGLAVAL
ncbi:MAG: hypothetical protein Q9170_005816 [Blastenia crenularia]